MTSGWRTKNEKYYQRELYSTILQLNRSSPFSFILHHIKPKDVQKLDSVDHIEELQQVGKTLAKKKVKKEHFPEAFDI